MEEGAWALVGAAVGAVLAGGIQLILSLVHRKWANQDAAVVREGERVARLFDHRRMAYVEFAEQLQNDQDEAFEWVWGMTDSMPDEYEVNSKYAPLSRAGERVGIFGSEEAYSVAREAIGVMLTYAFNANHGPDATSEIAKAADEIENELHAITDKFRRIVRSDLGVDSE